MSQKEKGFSLMPGLMEKGALIYGLELQMNYGIALPEPICGFLVHTLVGIPVAAPLF